MSKPISKFKQNFIIRNYRTMSVAAIARRLRIPYMTVYSRLYEQGLLDVKKQDTLDLESAVCRKVLAMYVQGWYLEDIAEESRRSEEVCARIIGRVFPAPDIYRRSAALQNPPDSYTGMTEHQMRMEDAGRHPPL